jgi:trehalose-6-phosphate synthase
MTAYEQVQADIETAVGRINGRFGSFDWQPVALISRRSPSPTWSPITAPPMSPGSRRWPTG